MSDLDQLLRDTLHARAATVTDAPALETDAPQRSDRSRWLLVAASVATVLLAGAAVGYVARNEHEQTQAGGDAASACAADLPTSWQHAVDAATLTADGAQAYPEEGSTNGSIIVGTYSKALGQNLYLRAKNGGSTKLMNIPFDRISGNTSWDGRYLAVGSAPKIPADSPDTPVDDIAVVDTVLHRTTHLLAKSPTPAGWVVGRGAVVVRSGIVYWGATPTSESESGIVLSYAMSTHRYRIVARLSVYPAVQPDPRGGVAWPGGRAGRIVAPARVPPVIDAAEGIPAYVVSDGRNWAWTYRTHDRATITWAAASGAGRSFVVDPIHDRRFPPSVNATAGPYVFFGLDEYGSVSYVLDTRTGAVAPTGNAEYLSTLPGRLFEQTSQDGAYHEVAVARLPELHCR